MAEQADPGPVRAAKETFRDKGIRNVGGGGQRGSQQDRHKLCSLSKSRKKFGPCSSSVQVSTFNRFPIWFLQERKEKEKGRKECVMLKGYQQVIRQIRAERAGDRGRVKGKGGESEGEKEEHKQTPSGLRHQEQRPADRKETAEPVSPLPTSPHLFLHPPFLPLFHSTARLTFKVQEKVWIVLYFPCQDFQQVTHSSKPDGQNTVVKNRHKKDMHTDIFKQNALNVQ